MSELDKFGEILLNWRIKAVLPFVRGKLLDLGCGTNKLVKLHGSGTGVDVHQFGGADLILNDTSKTPFCEESFDTITIVATLNHIPNRRQVLKEMNRILKSNGNLVVTMIPPFISRVWHFLRSPWDRDQTERGMAEGEVYGISNKDLKKLLGDANFLIFNQKRFMFGFNNIFIAKKV